MLPDEDILVELRPLQHTIDWHNLPTNIIKLERNAAPNFKAGSTFLYQAGIGCDITVGDGLSSKPVVMLHIKNEDNNGLTDIYAQAQIKAGDEYVYLQTEDGTEYSLHKASFDELQIPNTTIPHITLDV